VCSLHGFCIIQYVSLSFGLYFSSVHYSLSLQKKFIFFCFTSCTQQHFTNLNLIFISNLFDVVLLHVSRVYLCKKIKHLKRFCFCFCFLAFFRVEINLTFSHIAHYFYQLSPLQQTNIVWSWEHITSHSVL
jgi:hypothetical protein